MISLCCLYVNFSPLLWYTYSMNDEEQPNFERQVESQPEKSHRSVFDWLRGKEVVEQTEEEKLRKKIDEELKEWGQRN